MGPQTSVKEPVENLLQAAVNLEELTLAGELDVASLDFSSIFGSKTWSRLPCLELRSFTARRDDLKAFLKRHQGSLVFLLMDDFNLLAPKIKHKKKGWERLLDHVARRHCALTVYVGWIWVQSFRARVPVEERARGYCMYWNIQSQLKLN